MGSTVATERSKLQEQYPKLRARILGHINVIVALTGELANSKARKLPPKLGHWGPQHSAHVLAACPELVSIVHTIEALLARRDANLIASQHIRRKPGGRRKATTSRGRLLNPGEWPPRYA